MVSLEQDGIVDGVVLEDGDALANGGRVALSLSKLGRRKGKLMYKVFKRDAFMASSKPCNSNLCTDPTLITDMALMLGNDCMKRTH